jgi:hypothetical protein
VTIRYLILDPENREIDLNNIEENYEYRAKLLNPYKTYLQEENDKIKKQALEQIISNALLGVRDKKKTMNQSNSSRQGNININNTINSATNNNLNNSNISISLDSSIQKQNHKNSKENFDFFMKYFKDACEANNLVTVDQKIDYFVYMKNNPVNIKKDKIRGGTYIIYYL